MEEIMFNATHTADEQLNVPILFNDFIHSLIWNAQLLRTLKKNINTMGGSVYADFYFLLRF